MKYLGITYRLPANRITWWLWRRIFCPRGWHLFDEVSSVEWHYLGCDACGLAVQVADEDS